MKKSLFHYQQLLDKVTKIYIFNTVVGIMFVLKSKNCKSEYGTLFHLKQSYLIYSWIVKYLVVFSLDLESRLQPSILNIFYDNDCDLITKQEKVIWKILSVTR